MQGIYADWLKGLSYSNCVSSRAEKLPGHVNKWTHYLRVAREIRTDDLKQIVQTTMWLRLARRLQQPLEVRKPKEEK
jgi:hypothetical protein